MHSPCCEVRFFFQKYKNFYIFEKYFSGRAFTWVTCSLPTGCPSELASPELPFYLCREDPIYAKRIRKYRSDWNQLEYHCLYPMVCTRLYRVLYVINPFVDLYPVFDSSSDDEQYNS